MPILGINNRTENWKTARHFHPFFGDESVELAERLGEPEETARGKVHLELYWKGMRDHLHKQKRKIADGDFAESYTCRFAGLRKSVEDFTISGSPGFQELNDCNYDVSRKDRMAKLRNNLINTEIDIVLESPDHLYIGEAKHEMSFGADGSLILVHQLIRQYVMAKILLDIRGCTRDVVPFVVGDNAERLKKNRQVAFMICQGWMEKDNVLEWDDVKELACNS